MDQKKIFFVILGMAFVTYVPRMLPALALSSRSLPKPVVTWLGYVPAAVLAALLMPALLIYENRVSVGFQNRFLWSAIPAIAVAYRTKNFFLTVLVGLGVIAATRQLFG